MEIHAVIKEFKKIGHFEVLFIPLSRKFLYETGTDRILNSKHKFDHPSIDGTLVHLPYLQKLSITRLLNMVRHGICTPRFKVVTLVESTQEQIVGKSGMEHLRK